MKTGDKVLVKDDECALWEEEVYTYLAYQNGQHWTLSECGEAAYWDEAQPIPSLASEMLPDPSMDTRVRKLEDTVHALIEQTKRDREATRRIQAGQSALIIKLLEGRR